MKHSIALYRRCREEPWTDGACREDEEVLTYHSPCEHLKSAPPLDDVTALVSSHQPDVLALSETRLDSSIDDKEIFIHGFVLFHSDHNHCGVV